LLLQPSHWQARTLEPSQAQVLRHLRARQPMTSGLLSQLHQRKLWQQAAAHMLSQQQQQQLALQCMRRELGKAKHRPAQVQARRQPRQLLQPPMLQGLPPLLCLHPLLPQQQQQGWLYQEWHPGPLPRRPFQHHLLLQQQPC
jgi:hypothetical protein